MATRDLMGHAQISTELFGETSKLRAPGYFPIEKPIRYSPALQFLAFKSDGRREELENDSNILDTGNDPLYIRRYRVRSALELMNCRPARCEEVMNTKRVPVVQI